MRIDTTHNTLMPPPNHIHHQMQNLLLAPVNGTPLANIPNSAQRILSPIRIQPTANTTTPSIQDENEFPIVSVDENLFDTCEPSKKQTAEAAPVVQELREDTDNLIITVGAHKCTRLCLNNTLILIRSIPSLFLLVPPTGRGGGVARELVLRSRGCGGRGG